MATEVLTESGIDPSRLFTVEGGSKSSCGSRRSAELPIVRRKILSGSMYPVKMQMAAVGDDEVQFLDVRDDETYAAGHLEGSLQM